MRYKMSKKRRLIRSIKKLIINNNISTMILIKKTDLKFSRNNHTQNIVFQMIIISVKYMVQKATQEANHLMIWIMRCAHHILDNVKIEWKSPYIKWNGSKMEKSVWRAQVKGKLLFGMHKSWTTSTASTSTKNVFKLWHGPIIINTW